MQLHEIVVVTFSIVLDFLEPKVHVAFWQAKFITIVSVPETSVYENYSVVSAQNDVGSSCKSFYIQPIAVSKMPQPFSHQNFGFGVSASYVAHASMPLLGCHFVCHCELCNSQNY